MCHVPVSPAGISFVCFCLDSHGAWLGRDVGLVAGDTRLCDGIDRGHSSVEPQSTSKTDVCLSVKEGAVWYHSGTWGCQGALGLIPTPLYLTAKVRGFSCLSLSAPDRPSCGTRPGPCSGLLLADTPRTINISSLFSLLF